MMAMRLRYRRVSGPALVDRTRGSERTGREDCFQSRSGVVRGPTGRERGWSSSGSGQLRSPASEGREWDGVSHVGKKMGRSKSAVNVGSLLNG